MIKERWIVEKLLTQGAIRLPAVLNWIFTEVEDVLKRTSRFNLLMALVFTQCELDDMYLCFLGMYTKYYRRMNF